MDDYKKITDLCHGNAKVIEDIMDEFDVGIVPVKLNLHSEGLAL